VAGVAVTVASLARRFLVALVEPEQPELVDLIPRPRFLLDTQLGLLQQTRMGLAYQTLV
jgi:hypothetical protein